MTNGEKLPDPPAHVLAYVETLGVGDAIALFLAIGGTQIYLTKKPTRRSIILNTLDAAKAECLANRIGYGYHKVPVPKKWIAAVMRARDASNSDIARLLHVDVATVRRWLPPNDGNEQFDFFRKTGS
jgi:hypothetical protein